MKTPNGNPTHSIIANIVAARKTKTDDQKDKEARALAPQMKKEKTEMKKQTAPKSSKSVKVSPVKKTVAPEPAKGTVRALILAAQKRGTVRPNVKVDLKQTLSLKEASEFIKVNTGRVGWMTRAAGGNRLVAFKEGNQLRITKASLIEYRKHRDAYYSSRKH